MKEPTITRKDRSIEAAWTLGPAEDDYDRHENARYVVVLTVRHKGKPIMYGETGYRYTAHLDRRQRADAVNGEGERIGTVETYTLSEPRILIAEQGEAKRFNRKVLERFFRDSLDKAEEIRTIAMTDPEGMRSQVLSLWSAP